MTGLDRRGMLKLLAAAPAAAAFTWTDAEAAQAHRDARAALQEAQRAGAGYQPKFFNEREWAMLGILVDLIIPKDARSGSATDAGVPEFIDFMMVDQPTRQVAMRGGLAWIDLECHRRYSRMFADCADAERRLVLDDIAWPQRVKPGMSHGATFFSSLRDLTASGFWTTKMGIEDLGYMGNVYVASWDGCPPEALKKLGLSES